MKSSSLEAVWNDKVLRFPPYIDNPVSSSSSILQFLFFKNNKQARKLYLSSLSFPLRRFQTPFFLSTLCHRMTVTCDALWLPYNSSSKELKHHLHIVLIYYRKQNMLWKKLSVLELFYCTDGKCHSESWTESSPE